MKENGIEPSEEELLAVKEAKNSAGELLDEDLEEVAGGIGRTKTNYGKELERAWAKLQLLRLCQKFSLDKALKALGVDLVKLIYTK